MQYTSTKGEKGRIEIKVDIPQSAFDEAYNLVLTNHAKDAKIAGFRPGKAPLAIVEGHVGSNKVLNETANLLVSKHLADILKIESLTPVDSPKLAYDTLAKGSPFSFTVTFTELPKVTLGDWKKIKVSKVKVKTITDTDIEESIKNIFEAWKKRKDTKVTKELIDSEPEGSSLRVERPEEPKDTKDSEDSEMTDGTEGKKFIYDSHGNKVFFEGTKEEAKGTNEPGPEAKGPDDDSFDKAKDKPNDLFAKAIGAKDLAHLRELVKHDLEVMVLDQVEIKFEADIFAKLREISNVEVPDVLVDDEVNRMLINLAAELEKQGKELKVWLEEQKTTLEAIKAKWQEAAVRNVTTNLLINEIGKEEKVHVAQEEIDVALARMSEQNVPQEQKNDLQNYIAFNIFHAKTLELIKKTVSPSNERAGKN